MKKITQKALSVMMIMSMILTCMTVGMPKVNAASGDWGGSGSSEDPYTISDAEGLAKLATNVNNGNSYQGIYFTLTADIDLSAYDNWMPIGNNDNGYVFAGNFNGNGKKISNLKINRGVEYTGLFGRTNGSKIENLSIISGSINGGDYTGGVVGHQNSGEINNCSNIANINAASSIGGIVGYVASGSINNCFNISNITGNSNIGGVVGQLSAANINNCYNIGSITARSTSTESTGGIVGWGHSVSQINSCYNTGRIIGYKQTGGIVGLSRDIGINASFNIGVIYGNVMDIGGIVGEIYGGTINSCFNSGSVSGQQNVGGVAGVSANSVSINNSYNTGSVTGQYFTGGLVGSNRSTLSRCYNAGSVYSATSNGAGGLAGCNDTGGTVEYNYFNTDILNKDVGTNYGTRSNNLGRNTKQMTGDDALTNYMSNLPTRLWRKYSSGDLCCGSVSYYPTLMSVSSDTIKHMMTRLSTIAKKPDNVAADEEPFFEDYYVYTAEQLNHVRKHLSYTFSLQANISLARFDWEGWVPIKGNGENYFTGFFDGNNGNGYMITNLYVNRGNTDYVGLFSRNAGTVYGLTIVNSEVGGKSFVGGVAGLNSGSIEYCEYSGNIWSNEYYTGGIAGKNANVGTVMGCTHTGDVGAVSHAGGIVGQNNGGIVSCTNYYGEIRLGTTGERSVGGITGFNEEGTIYECVNYALVNSRYNMDGAHNTGGIAGTNFAYINRCKNYGDVLGHATSGGVVGLNYGEVFDCENSGEINASCPGGGIVGRNVRRDAGGLVVNCTNTGAVFGYLSGNKNLYRVGGVVGYNESGYIGYCNNKGEITGTGSPDLDSSVGGISGYSDGIIAESYNEGNVTGSGNWIGGVAGRVYGGSIEYCYNDGAVDGQSGVGGVAGNDHTGSIIYCYNTGIVSGSENVGGVAGWSDAAIEDCYNTGDVTSSGDYTGGIAGLNAIYDSDNKGTIDNCNNSGEISGLSYAGGIAGKNDNTITRSYNTGITTATSYYAGGIAGYQADGALINRCYNNGVVDGGSRIGGLAGQNTGTVQNCYNTGDISGESRIGGVIGENSKLVQFCYNTGHVGSTENYFGGISGTNYSIPDTSITATVKKCVNAGSVNGGDFGGSIGYNDTGFTSDNYRYKFAAVNENVISDTGGNNGATATAVQLNLQDWYIANGWTFSHDNWIWETAGFPKLGIGTEENLLNFNLKTLTINDLDYNLQAVTYNGSGQPVSVTAKSSVTGMGEVTVTYNNSADVPADAGTYTVRAIIEEGAEYYGETLMLGDYVINPIPVTINISNTTQVYNNTARYVTVSTSPDVEYTVTYSQGGTTVASPTDLGSYDVKVIVTAANYTGEKTAVLIISDKYIPDVTWPEYDEITYGSKTSDAVLLAEGSAVYNGSGVPGDFIFEYPDDIPVAGDPQVSMRFIPEDTVTYAEVTGEVRMKVNKADYNLVITGIPGSITCGDSFTLHTTGGGTGIVTYTSSNVKIAAINGSTVTAVGAGTATITAVKESDDNYNRATATNTITVKSPPVTDLRLNTTSKKLVFKSKFTLKATVIPANADSIVSYSSSNTKVASVDSKGIITAKKVGTATITAKAGNISKTCKVTVTKKQLSKPAKLELTAKKATWKKVNNNSGYTLKILQGKKVIVKATIKKGKTSYKIKKGLLKKGKKYTFTLIAKGKGNYKNSKTAKKSVRIK